MGFNWVVGFLFLLVNSLVFGREIILDTDSDLSEWGEIVCHYADVTEDFALWGCPTDLPLGDQDSTSGFWSECKRECYIEYNQFPSNLHYVQMRNYVSGGSAIQVEVLTAEKRETFAELDESSPGYTINIPEDADFDDVVMTLDSRVGSTLVDSITIVLQDGSLALFNGPIAEDDPEWESTCLHQVSYEDFYHWGCPVSTEDLGGEDGDFWTNCQESCTITYKGRRSKPTYMDMGIELSGDGKIHIEGRINAKYETPATFTPISNTRAWLDSYLDLSPFPDATKFRIRMTHQDGGFALISRISLIVEDGVTPGPHPNPLIVTLDSVQDLSDSWTVDCRYGEDYNDLVNNRHCQVERKIQESPGSGFWTSCAYKEESLCTLIYYGHKNPKPVSIDLTNFIESDNSEMNGTITVAYKQSLNNPDVLYEEVFRKSTSGGQWAYDTIDLPYSNSFVLRFQIYSHGMGSALIDNIIITLDGADDWTPPPTIPTTPTTTTPTTPTTTTLDPSAPTDDPSASTPGDGDGAMNIKSSAFVTSLALIMWYILEMY